MRLLFEIDRKNYENCTHTFVRNSARSIIIRGEKLAMIFSRKDRYYKLPGGGIEQGEDYVTAMIRETLEEVGLTVKPETVREFGYVHRIQKGSHGEGEVFIQDNFYYFCEAEDGEVVPTLTESEKKADYVPVFVEPEAAIAANKAALEAPNLPDTAAAMLEREIRVLEMLLEEDLLGK